MPAVPTLFLAPTAAEARHAAWQFLSQRGVTSPLDPPLVFLGSGGAENWRDLAREETSRTRTVPRLVRAEDFFARAHGALARQRFLSGTDRLWVISGVLAHFVPGKHLEKLVKGRDFAAHFATWVARLRRSGLSQFPTGELSSELNELVQHYDRRLQVLKAFDYEAAPTLFAESAPRNRAFSWPQALIVDDLLDPSPTLQIGLKALFERAEFILGTLVYPGGSSSNPALESALEFWRSLGAEVVRVGDFATEPSRAAARILGDEIEVRRPSQVSLTAAHTPWDEMNRVAAQIRRQVEAGAQPDDFAIALADLNSYEWPARHAFAAQGVPLDWPRDSPLRASPLVRALLQAAQGCRDKWNVHELHDLFGDGTLELRLENLRFDAKRLRAAARAARYFDLVDLERTRHAFDAKVVQFVTHAKLDEAPRRAAIEAALVAGDLELVAHFKTLCLALDEKLTASAWQLRLLQLIEALAGHWFEIQSEAGQTAQAILQRFKEAIQCVAERARGWSDAESEEPSRRVGEWLHWLDLEIDVSVSSRSDRGGVHVASASAPLDARRTLFFCGLNEGAWPVSRSSGTLGEPGRELDLVLRAHETAPIARATHILARSLSNKGVSLSYAAFIDGHETPASPVLDDLKAAWKDEESGWPELPSLEGFANYSRRAHLVEINRWMVSSHPKPGDEPSLLHFGALTQMRAQRRDVELGVYDGVLGARGRVLMDEWRQLQRSDALSVSALERYAACPLRYFFERIIGLEADEEITDDLDPRAAGNLVHSITHLFLGAWTSPLHPDDFDGALKQLGDITRGECDKLPIRPILREAEYHRLMGADEKSGPLVKWLKLEIGLGNGAWSQEMRPLLQTSTQIEGMRTGLEQRFEIEVSGHKIRGIIDRLDSSPDGDHLAVIDYKTGDISGLPSWRAGDDGLHFQLAVYALAARDLTHDRPLPPRLAMAYLTMRRAKIARGIGQEGTLGKGCSGAKTLSDSAFEAWLNDVSARAARIADLRNVGTFNISLQSTRDAKCDTCGSKSLCGQHQATQAARLEAHRSSPFFYAPDLWEWE
jgi:RecB family exonuclease